MKKYFAGLLTGVIITLGITVFAESVVTQAIFTDEIKLKVNGSATPATFVNVNGTNYGKVRDIVAAIGGVTAWDNDTKTILVNTADKPTVTPVAKPTPTPASNAPTNIFNDSRIRVYNTVAIQIPNEAEFVDYGKFQNVIKYNNEYYVPVSQFLTVLDNIKFIEITEDIISLTRSTERHVSIHRAVGDVLRSDSEAYVKYSIVKSLFEVE